MCESTKSDRTVCTDGSWEYWEPASVTIATFTIYDYLDQFKDIDELRKAAKVLLKQDGVWLDEAHKEIDELKALIKAK
jgi:hypothetical protein